MVRSAETSAETARGEVPARPGASPTSKRAAQLADQIVGDIMAMGWPVGGLFGSEGELLERYRVSRAVFREAVRLLEHQQVARTRRGPGGGLVITEPTVDAVIDAVVLYLYRVDARLDELFEARIAVEEIVAELAPGRLDEQDLTRLRTFTGQGDHDLDADPRALHAVLASITRNPALELFVDVLNRVAMLYSTDWQSLRPAVGAAAAQAHARIAEAVIAGDAGLARHRMRKHLEAEGEFLRRRRSTCELLPDNVVVLGESSNGKRAETVARHITQEIVGGGLRPGQFVGAEKDLIEAEGVSRAVLREAVRLLEHHQIARMRRGPGGGLFVFEPSTVAVTDVVAIYLARKGMRLAGLAELRTGIELALAGLAADRIDAAGRARIAQALEREKSSPDTEHAEVVHDLHAAVASAAHSRALELVALVLIRLSRLHQIERLAPKERTQIAAEVLRTHEGIAAAIEDGDRELARHRIKRHLDALAALIS
ncbi:MAG TPA: FCD domain-containing protein [Streptosporangiaceae bacterium]|nr:FCD domain-containing protein [Streptosporangiaceae bacterium]